MSVVWALLVGASLVSWQIGAHGGHGGRNPLGLAILAIALVKVRLVGLHFMDLRRSARALRLIFEFYALAAFLALTATYLLG